MKNLGAKSLAGLSGYEQLYPKLVPRPSTVQPTTVGRSKGWCRCFLPNECLFFTIKHYNCYLLSERVHMRRASIAVANT